MANTLNPEKLAAHKDMLLDQYRSELKRLADRVEAAQARMDPETAPGTIGAALGRGRGSRVSHHDPYNMANVVSELSRLAGAIELLETVERSLE